MPRSHPPYAPEYRRRIIELARSGRKIDELAASSSPRPTPSANGSSRQSSTLGPGFPVVVNGNGRLGIQASSARYKP